MARKKASVIDDLLVIAGKLPWHVDIALAVASYIGFHLIATMHVAPTVATDVKQFAQNIGGTVISQFLIAVSSLLQYVVPLAFLTGAVASVYKRSRRKDLFSRVADTPLRNELEKMSWREFEDLTAEVFRRRGFEVVERGGAGPDGGVDIELRAGEDTYLVQCKQWKVLKVGVATVRELYGVMAAEGAVGGFVVASGEFTEEAKRFAEGRSIELVPTNLLLRMVKASGGAAGPQLTPAPDAATCPMCGSAMVKRIAKRGGQAGSEFWGCSRYPACTGTRAIV